MVTINDLPMRILIRALKRDAPNAQRSSLPTTRRRR